MLKIDGMKWRLCGKSSECKRVSPSKAKFKMVQNHTSTKVACVISLRDLPITVVTTDE